MASETEVIKKFNTTFEDPEEIGKLILKTY